MKSTQIRRRGASAALVAGLLTVLVPASARAASTVAELRVEALGQTLEPGTGFATGTVAIRTDPGAKCFIDGSGGSGATATLPGPTALGIVKDASGVNDDLPPLSVTDEFSFGLGVCGVGGYKANASRCWCYQVDNAAPPTSGDHYALERRDRVLWYLADYSAHVNDGAELVLEAPANATPGQPFTVKALAYPTFGSGVSPADGATVSGGPAPVVTDANGEATITATDDVTLRATRPSTGGSDPGEIPSNRVHVCVDSGPEACPANHGLVIYGTAGNDRIGATGGWDVVRSRAGNDEVLARFKGRDRVNCGRGQDVVHADGRDVILNCEEVLRR